MKFTDIFVRRPVLASVVSLLILLVGLRAVVELEVRQFPEIKNTIVTVSTRYSGASDSLVKDFITTPLQQAIAEAEGIDFLEATSRQGVSTIDAHMKLNVDPSLAVADIQAKVASQRNQLPSESDDPVISSKTGGSGSLMYLSYYSEVLTPSQVSDYLLRVVQPKYQALEGVGKALVLGKRTFAMRIWLDPRRMAALKISPVDVDNALRDNNFLSSVGKTQGDFFTVDLNASTDISSVEEFENLVVANVNGTLIHLKDVARIELGSEDYESINWYRGYEATFVAIEPSPGSNPLTVAALVREAFEVLERDLPEGIESKIPYDASQFIQASIDEVITTLVEAVAIVLLVIYLFLGSFRAALVPSITVPLSLVGGAFLMLMMGFSINLLTLLAMVLAIGMVVDDAIVVVENVHRHIHQGKSKFQAAMIGARELAAPIIAMTTTLVAVYAPIGFMGGLVGTLFTEFAYALAGSVVISGVVALTLAPMMSGAVLKDKGRSGRFENMVEAYFNRLSLAYNRILNNLLEKPSIPVLFAMATLVSIPFMFSFSQKELAPREDQGTLYFLGVGPETATLKYVEAYTREIAELFETFPEYKDSFLLLGFGGASNAVFGGFKLKPIAERERSQDEVHPELQAKIINVAGLRTAIIPKASLPGSGGGLPIQFVITSTAEYEELEKVADELISRSMKTGDFIFLVKDVEYSRPKASVVIDRDRAADLGISMSDIGQSLSSMLADGKVNRFSLFGRSYKVIPQVEQKSRLNTSVLEDLYVHSANGEQIPLSSLVHIETRVGPNKRTQFQQLNSLIVQGSAAPGVTTGDALNTLQGIAGDVFPPGYSNDYKGASRQFIQQGSALMLTFFMSLLVIYLVLAAQFESWRDPLIILVSVPLSLASALAFIMLGMASINIYTQIGLITLIGLISKNGILIVEFANQLQVKKGLGKREAVEEAATIRLRPILMTSAAMIMAMLPLLMSSGPGAASRFDIGLVIASGLGVGTLFTLFVVPAFYVLLAKDRNKGVVKETPEEAPDSIKVT